MDETRIYPAFSEFNKIIDSIISRINSSEAITLTDDVPVKLIDVLPVMKELAYLKLQSKSFINTWKPKGAECLITLKNTGLKKHQRDLIMFRGKSCFYSG